MTQETCETKCFVLYSRHLMNIFGQHWSIKGRITTIICCDLHALIWWKTSQNVSENSYQLPRVTVCLFPVLSTGYRVILLDLPTRLFLTNTFWQFRFKIICVSSRGIPPYTWLLNLQWTANPSQHMTFENNCRNPKRSSPSNSLERAGSQPVSIC